MRKLRNVNIVFNVQNTALFHQTRKALNATQTGANEYIQYLAEKRMHFDSDKIHQIENNAILPALLETFQENFGIFIVQFLRPKCLI